MNSFPQSYSNIGGTNLPVDLFPTYDAIEHAKIAHEILNSSSNLYWTNGLSSSSPLSSMVSDGGSRGVTREVGVCVRCGRVHA
ncbi:hypothetical protein ACFX2I_024139 [Malus domestica]